MKLTSRIGCWRSAIGNELVKKFTTRAALVLLGCVLVMLFTAPARADVCSDAFSGNLCGVTIEITGVSSGHLVATLGGTGTHYDCCEDQLVGVTNNSSVTVGAIVLSGPLVTEPIFGFDGDGPCVILGGPTVCGTPTGYEGPRNTFVGISSDETTGKVLFTTPLAPGETTWFALENIPTKVVAIGETKALVAGQEITFPFGPFVESPTGTFTEQAGPDNYKIKPLNSTACPPPTPTSPPCDTLTITPVPVPAGPLGSGTFGPFPSGAGGFGNNQFGVVTPGPLPPGPSRFSASNFANRACVPYKDFTGSGDPVCVEIERDCLGTGCGTGLLYTAELNYSIDGNSLPNGIGGPSFLGRHVDPCPTSAFDLNILTTYIGATVDPLRGSGSGGGSCFVAAFDPSAATIATNDTFSAFVGFLDPVSDTDLNLVKAGQAVPLKWQLFSSPGVPLVENLHLCNNSIGTGCTAPWAFVGTVKTSCIGDPTPNDDVLDVTVAAGSAIQNFGNGTYQFNLNTKKGSTGCFDAVLVFDSGLTVFPANFKYK